MRVLFLMENPYFVRFRDELFDLGAHVNLSQRDKDVYVVRIEKILDNLVEPSDQSDQNERWLSKMRKYYTDFFALFDSQVLKIESSTVLSDISKLNLHLGKVDGKEDMYELLGPKESVAEALVLIQNAEKASKKYDADAEIVDDEISGLKLHQIRILFVNKYIKCLQSKYSHLMVRINTKNRNVQYKGARGQINEAKLLLADILDRVKTKTIPGDEMLVKFVLAKEMDIVSWLKEKVRLRQQNCYYFFLS